MTWKQDRKRERKVQEVLLDVLSDRAIFRDRCSRAIPCTGNTEAKTKKKQNDLTSTRVSIYPTYLVLPMFDNVETGQTLMKKYNIENK